MCARLCAAIPDPLFSGFGVIDFETWQPTWAWTGCTRRSAEVYAAVIVYVAIIDYVAVIVYVAVIDYVVAIDYHQR